MNALLFALNSISASFKRLFCLLFSLNIEITDDRAHDIVDRIESRFGIRFDKTNKLLIFLLIFLVSSKGLDSALSLIWYLERNIITPANIKTKVRKAKIALDGLYPCRYALVVINKY